MVGRNPLSIAVVGAGRHCRQSHLPALVKYRDEHPGAIELAAICDIDGARAAQTAAEFGFERRYADVDEMLRDERPSACVVAPPLEANARLAMRAMNAGAAVLMEKPPGASIGEARNVVEHVRNRTAVVMVSFNRRFDPAVSAARRWLADRKIETFHAAMIRRGRTEPNFLIGTGIHAVDAMRSIAGDVRSFLARRREVAGAFWYVVEFEFAGGATGVLEVLPTAGCSAEVYDIRGGGFRAVAQAGLHDRGRAMCWTDGEVALDETADESAPMFIRDGTWAETCAFLNGVLRGAPVHPSPADTLQSVEIVHAIEAGQAEGQFPAGAGDRHGHADIPCD